MNIKVDIGEIKENKMYVSIDFPKGNYSMTGNNLFLVFTEDEADRLAFQIGAGLQEKDVLRKSEAVDLAVERSLT
jgi:uncharacterized protein YijF (DUF1287 family)